MNNETERNNASSTTVIGRHSHVFSCIVIEGLIMSLVGDKGSLGGGWWHS